MFQMFESLVAKDNEEKVIVLHSQSYEHRKSYMSKIQTDEFK